MSQNVKVALAVLSAVAIGLQTGYPHAAWTIPVISAITAALGALHLVPGAPASQPSGAANVPGS